MAPRGVARGAQRAGFSSNDIRRWLDHRLTVVMCLIIARGHCTHRPTHPPTPTACSGREQPTSAPVVPNAQRQLSVEEYGEE